MMKGFLVDYLILGGEYTSFYVYPKIIYEYVAQRHITALIEAATDACLPTLLWASVIPRKLVTHLKHETRDYLNKFQYR